MAKRTPPAGAEDRPPGRFAGLGQDHLALLGAAGVVHAWSRGEILMRQGERGDRAILLRQGLVKITTESANGYTSLLAFRGPGELVGELAVLDGGARSATVTAVRPVRGVIIPASRFAALIQEHGDLALAVLRGVSGRLRHSDRHREALGSRSAAVRIAHVLLEFAERHGTAAADRGPTALAVSMTQQELAGAAGTSRESVVRTLRDLHDLGLVAMARGVVVVLDPAKLDSWDSDSG
ncbi:Crp/Fnr family transcriptional regulator [Streptomyces sp. NPDC101178]|uniref:Crp/Fnr family transcriptional regulator n=1 Tax=Streptomyces sp. NPDC101178 TaxID=3366124 RepID=UPI0038193DE0